MAADEPEADAPEAEIPADRLPPGFASRLDDPPADPARPRPAATAVLLRRAAGEEAGVEVLLVQRSRNVGFVPGAYVFPGGRVDPADGDPRAIERLSGSESPGLESPKVSADGGPPPSAFLVAAYRETFEETGLLPDASPQLLASPRAGQLRQNLLADEIPFHAVLEALELRLRGDAAAFIAHWVTPEVEPRRYDTRFFALHVRRGLQVRPHPGEIIDTRWLRPREALERHDRGELPMVFPAIHTLRALRNFSSPAAVLEHFRGRRIARILPRLLRTDTGVAIQMPDSSD